jgi:hypothetical protein
MSSHPEGMSCSDLGQVDVLNDPHAWPLRRSLPTRRASSCTARWRRQGFPLVHFSPQPQSLSQRAIVRFRAVDTFRLPGRPVESIKQTCLYIPRNVLTLS